MTLPGLDVGHPADPAIEAVVKAWLEADPTLEQTGQVFRQTFDQLYDGQHTGRYRWSQLFKTEKTHFGTLLEINLRRTFDSFIQDGNILDYRIAGHEIDCKYSQTLGGWMIPPEAFGRLLLVAHAKDEAGMWQLGVVRASEDHLNRSENRDRKRTLSFAGRAAILWIAANGKLPPNVLLELPPASVERIFAGRSGQERVNRLCRETGGRRFGRNTVATVAMQDDFMKRMRENGGARSTLAAEGYIIPSGDYAAHRKTTRELGAMVPSPGEFVALRLVEVDQPGCGVVHLDDRYWRLASPDEAPSVPAPKLPSVKRTQPPG